MVPGAFMVTIKPSGLTMVTMDLPLAYIPLILHTTHGIFCFLLMGMATIDTAIILTVQGTECQLQ